ncbi:RHS repeat-associated core domain-containing protein [Schleiferia thermophila]|uniref:RHS repeat-associated core domain-containing protein n=1 Tax=Schleiferia thermophila TaxID=884107 RepID=UPI001F2277EA|nr:RHS repeat-associated core domain-containing protein [Schleiferia thermophila]
MSQTRTPNSTDFSTPYRFNAKELDSESGLFYYGARYYHPVVSKWLSVDPLASEFPAWTPNNYTMNNPVYMMDPDGRAPQGSWVFSAGFRMGLGTGGANIHILGSFGYLHRTDNFMALCYASGSIYGGQQLGTSNSIWYNADITVAGFAAFGSGQAPSHPINGLNYDNPLPATNDFKRSFGVGLGRTYNFGLNSRGDGPGGQWTMNNNIRTGSDFSITHSNDGYLDLALGWTGLSFKNQDAGHTGAMSFHLGAEGKVSFGYQQFTGSIIGGPSQGSGFYPQTKFQQSFNRSNTFLQIGGLRADYSTQPWMQNLLHDNVTRNPRFNPQNSNLNIFNLSVGTY